jgi:hypothetical protein
MGQQELTRAYSSYTYLTTMLDKGWKIESPVYGEKPEPLTVCGGDQWHGGERVGREPSGLFPYESPRRFAGEIRVRPPLAIAHTSQTRGYVSLCPPAGGEV